MNSVFKNLSVMCAFGLVQAGCGQSASEQLDSEFERMASELSIQESVNPLSFMGEVAIAASGFKSTEGPVWHAPTQSMLFSDIPGDAIYSLNVETGDISILRSPSSNANGLALDGQGYLLAAEQGSRTITRMNMQTGQVSGFISTVMLDGQEKALNSPNDMAEHRSSGKVFFTDPPFGLRGATPDLDFNGFYVHADDGGVTLLGKYPSGHNPNGVIFNPDQSRLYLAISHNDSGPILAYDVSASGELSGEREFARVQNGDGMAMDIEGNLYVATLKGVRVFSKGGEDYGMISLPGDIRTTNCAFGGPDMKTLYITNRSADIYAVNMPIKGHIP